MSWRRSCRRLSRNRHFSNSLARPACGRLADTIAHARQKGLLVIVDAKRNDIGSTAEAYADAFLGPGGASAGGDALTVSPYLGNDTLTPFVEVAQQQGAGLFILVKTSNPGGGQFQDLVADGQPIYRHVAEHVERLNASGRSAAGYGNIGAVVGATYPEQLADSQAMPHAWLLVPGYGSQGATATDVARAFDASGLGAVVNNSRGIIFAHVRKPYAEPSARCRQGAVEAATRT